MNYSLTKTDLKKQSEKGVLMTALRRLVPLMAEEKRAVTIALVAILVSSAATLIVPIIIARIVDGYIVTKNFHGVLIYSIWLLLIFIIGLVASYIQIKAMGGVGRRLLFNLRNKIFHKLQELPVAPAILALVATQLLSPWVKRTSLKSLRTLGAMSGEIQESINNFKVIVAFNRLDYFRDKFKESNEANYQASISAGIASNIFNPMYVFASALAQLVVLAYGIYLISTSHFVIGLLIGFLLYVNNFYTPLRQLASVWPSLQLALAGLLAPRFCPSVQCRRLTCRWRLGWLWIWAASAIPARRQRFCAARPRPIFCRA